MNLKTFSLISFAALAPLTLLASNPTQIQMQPNGPVSIGQTVVLSLPSSARGATYKWQADSGGLIGPVNKSIARFTAVEPGRVAITCVEVRGGRRKMYTLALQVSPSPTHASTESSTAPYDIGRGGFAPSGWMGDAGDKAHPGVLRVDVAARDNPHSPPVSEKWEYKPLRGGQMWAAVAWQCPPLNWGEKEGRNLSGKGFTELSIWARGLPDKKDRFPVIQFKAGGGTSPTSQYQASFENEGDFVTLTSEWKRYTVSLSGKNLTQVVSAVTFVLRAEDNPDGAVFFLDDLEYR